MSILAGLIGPVATLIDKIVPDPRARDQAKLELLRLESSQELEAIRIQMSAIGRASCRERVLYTV